MNTKHIDARRLLCPMPVIRTQDAVADMQPGEQLVITCTDPGALKDIPAWCRINGHRVVETRQEGDDIIITVEVGA